MPIPKSWLAKPLEYFYKFLYHPFAWTYDFVAYVVSVGQWKDWVLTILPELSGGKTLEIGHGPGHLQIELMAKSNEVFGLDFSAQMGRMAFRRIEKAKMEPRITNGDVHCLPFPKSTFDNIASTFPSDYIKSPENIKEIYRVLKPGGNFVFIPAASITGDSFLHKLAATLFKITGQNSGIDKGSFSNIISEYQKIGFNVILKDIYLENSSLLLYHCQKQINP